MTPGSWRLPRPWAVVGATVATALIVVGCGPRPAQDRLGAPATTPVVTAVEAQPPTDPATADIDVSADEAPVVPPPTTPAPAAVFGAFDAEGARDFAAALATEIGPRPAGSEADRVTRERIEQALVAAGWHVRQEEVALPQGGVTANVVAWQTPGDPRLGPHLVLGAHHDTVEGAPGANDNASGVGTLVVLARELADEEPAIPLVLVAFGAEEIQTPAPRVNHVGSTAYVASHGEHVVAALSIDMVANGLLTCICWLEDTPSTLADRLAHIVRAEVDGVFELRTAPAWSDHAPFALAGIPAAFLWTGDDGRFHTPADTAEHLDTEDLRRAGALALAFVRNVTSGDLPVLREQPPQTAIREPRR